jgi:hypothetical protein
MEGKETRIVKIRSKILNIKINEPCYQTEWIRNKVII